MTSGWLQHREETQHPSGTIVRTKGDVTKLVSDNSLDEETKLPFHSPLIQEHTFPAQLCQELTYINLNIFKGSR